MIVFLRVITLVFFIYATCNVAYLLIFSVAGLLAKNHKHPHRVPTEKFCVMIPAYKSDDVLINAVAENLKQHYPQNLYDIYVIADSFKPETIEALKNHDVTVIEVKFDKSTKAKSINKAFEYIDDEKYNYLVLLDVDNIMDTEFLQVVNNRLATPAQIIQGQRVALNTDTGFAILDGISEAINNHILRKGHAALGFSTALIGSGMIFDFGYFKKTMSTINAVGGFDKELELKSLRKRIKMHYLPEAVVYDEKVRQAEVFQTQRMRWISAQIYYMRRYFFSGIVQLFKGNFDYADKTFQLIMTPKILLLGILIIFTGGIDLSGVHWYNQYWHELLLFLIIALAIAIPAKFYTKKTLMALLLLPKAFLLFFATIFKLRGANTKFLHTPHGKKPQ